MLIHPWDAAISETEWRDWLAGHDFGRLAVNDPDNGAPHVIPTHFARDNAGDALGRGTARGGRSRWHRHRADHGAWLPLAQREPSTRLPLRLPSET
jgi:hypothetical protein